mgnify:CR=1 FL=1
MDAKQKILREVFGYPDFREGQTELIDSLLGGRDAVGIMPTGAGKSICYQVPALLLPGITVVVSPLISLMKDQVNALVQSGVHAAYLNSSLSEAQARKAMSNARAGVYKIIYVAPERLLTPSFLSLSQAQEISLVCVDEAHCVSQWGQDFRPNYLDVPRYLETLPARPPVGAFTATATAEVREDIMRLLGLRDPKILVTGFDRPNLYFAVDAPKDKYAALRDYLENHRGASGIVYCLTRKTVEEVTTRLVQDGFAAARYHAGLESAERQQNQDDFLYDRARIMVATNAFGMGIDKSNVSFVIHYNMPKNLESYYQEAGRAGRDGERADCLLLYSGRDVKTNEFLIDHGEGRSDLDEEQSEQLRQRDRDRLRQMTFYATTRGCLRAFLLDYFGEQIPPCGNCSNCLANYETLDAAPQAAALLTAILASGRHYGAARWRTAMRADETFFSWDERRIRELISFLLERGLLLQSSGDYPVLSVSDAGEDFVQSPEPLPLKVLSAKKETRRAAQGAEGVDPRLYAKLEKLRLEAARRAGVPAFVIFTNATLQEMCRRRPRTPEELLQVPGVGQAKVRHYGDEFLAVLRRAAAED